MIRVQDIMTRGALTLRADATADDARDTLLAHRIGGAPVVEDQRVVGVISKTDLLRANAQAVLRDVMTPYVQFVRPSDPAQVAVDLMLSEHMHRLVVMGSDGHVAGMVTQTDVLRAVQRGDTIHIPPEFPHHDPAPALLDEDDF
jgi:CBS-domain-containing membrane protein